MLVVREMIMRTTVIKSIVEYRTRSAVALAFIALLALLSGSGTHAQVLTDSYVCFPTCEKGDGRFLVVSGDTSSFVAQTLKFNIYAAPDAEPGASTFNIGIFDGDINTNWDVPSGLSPAPNLRFTLYRDPKGDGSGAAPVLDNPNVVGTWTTAGTSPTFVNDIWTALHPTGFTTEAAALKTGCTGVCPYVYLLTVAAADTNLGQNAFKLRTTGTLGLTNQAFGFLTPPQGSWPVGAFGTGLANLNASYDGAWSFGFEISEAPASITVWDGDFDYGDALCSSLDTNDGNTPNLSPAEAPNTIFPFPFVSPGAKDEGVAVGATRPCAPAGIGAGIGVGNPPDDALGPNLRRSPSYGNNVVYKITSPIGQDFKNLNPSGNLEWEMFKIGNNDITDADAEQTVPSLFQGLYRIKLEGMDVGNQNFWYIAYDLVGVTGPDPVCRDCFYTIDRYVFFDSNGDGVKQTGESGIAGAVVDLLKQASITSIAHSGTTATVTTVSAHGYVPGVSVTISGAVQPEYNGTFTITSVTDPTTFTYTVSGSALDTEDGASLMSAGVAETKATDSLGEFKFRVAPGVFSVRVNTLAPIGVLSLTHVNTGTGAIVTGTTGAPHGYAAGAKVTIAGASPAGYNGTFTMLSVPSPTTFTYATTTTLDGAATGTTITAVNVLNGLFATTPVSFSGLDMGPSKSAHERRDFGFVNTAPAISLVKKTNGSDNNTTPGLGVTTGEVITWTYLVTNTGGTVLSNVTLSDDKLGALNCPKNALVIGEFMTCTATGTASVGQYTNVGTVVGTPPAGSNVSATDPDNYFASGPSISIVKKTNGTDNTSGTGPFVAVGSPVVWTYSVTNIGDVALSTVVVNDDNGTAATTDDFAATYQSGDADSDSTLDLTETWTFTATKPAIAGQYINNGCAVGAPPSGANVNACDPDRYYGQTPAITLVKTTNGTNNNSAPGVQVATGSTVTWTYLITNTGNVPLTAVSLTDDKLGALGCPDNTLAIGVSMTCTATGTATVGQYTNVGTVVGTPPVGSNVTATDPDNYFGIAPASSVRIQKISVGGVGTFNFTNTNPAGPTTLRTVTAGTAAGVTVSNVASGTYTVTETALPSGWAFTSLACTGGGNNTTISGRTATIGVDPGENIVCTFTNTTSVPWVGTGDTATIGFWHNSNGQALIKQMNGAPTSKTFANWLASSFPYLYGANSANNLKNKTNVDVAALFVKLFTSAESPKTSAQVMANAIAVYVTNTTLAGGSYAGSYGFNLSSTGTGAKVYNVGTSGTAIGLQNDTNYTVSQILAQANLTKAAGTFNTVAFNDICEGINSQGGIG